MPFIPDEKTAPKGFIPDKTPGFVPDAPEPKDEYPVLIPNRVRDSELKSIAAKHGVAAPDLSEWVGWYGGLKTDNNLSDFAKIAAGETATAVAAGIPQLLAKKTQDPAMRAALDDLSSLVDEKKSLAQKGAELVGGVAASLKLAGRAASLAPKFLQQYQLLAPAIGGAAAGLGSSKEGEELKGAGVGAALGGVLGAVPAAIGAVRGAIKPTPRFALTGAKTLDESIQEVLEKNADTRETFAGLVSGRIDINKLTPDEMVKLVGKAGLSPEEYKNQLVSQLDNLKKDIAGQKIGDSSTEGFNELTRDLGIRPGNSPEAISKAQDTIEEIYKSQAEKRAAGEVGKTASREYTPTSQIEDALLTFADGKPLANIVDKKLGSKVAIEQDRASQKLNEFTTAFFGVKKKAGKLSDKATPETDANLYNLITSGNTAQSAEAQGWKEVFDEARDIAIEQGAVIPKRANYLPMKRPPLKEYKVAIAKRAEATGLDNLLEDKELLNEVDKFFPGKIKSTEDAQQALNYLLADNGQVFGKLDFAASLTKARDTELPDWLRDKNLPRLLAGWTSSISKQQALEPWLKEVDKASTAARFAGDDLLAVKLDKLANDALGNTNNIFSDAWNKFFPDYAGTLERKLAQAKGYEKDIIKGKMELPTVLNHLGSRIYRNALGLSPKAAVQNLLSPWTQGMVELGADRASILGTEAVGKLAKVMTAGEKIILTPATARYLGKQAGEEIVTRNPSIYALNQGLMGPNWERELLDTTYKSRKNGLVRNALGKVDKGFEKIEMAAFNSSEAAGRAMAAFMAEGLAKQLKANPELIDKVVQAPAYRPYLKKVLAEGDDKAFNKAVLGFYNGQTMLNYDTINMSQFSRTVGPLLRQFTKFPAYHSGRVAQQIYDKGAVGGATDLAANYLAPFGALALVDHIGDLDESPRTKTLLGRDALSGLAPALSIKNPVTGIESNAFVRSGKTLYNTVKSVANGSDAGESSLKAVDKLYNTFGVGPRFMKFISDDLPTIIDNKE